MWENILTHLSTDWFLPNYYVRFIGSARMQIERGKERFVDQHAKQKKSSALIDDMLSYPSSCTTLGHITICSKLGDQSCLDRGESALNNKQQTTNNKTCMSCSWSGRGSCLCPLHFIE